MECEAVVYPFSSSIPKSGFAFLGLHIHLIISLSLCGLNGRRLVFPSNNSQSR